LSGLASVAKYMIRRRQPPSQTWRSFLRNHIGQIVAADFFVVPTATYRLLFVLILLAHDRRRIVHVAVTAHPTAERSRTHLSLNKDAPIPRPIAAPDDGRIVAIAQVGGQSSYRPLRRRSRR
jgi:hypothetical protein